MININNEQNESNYNFILNDTFKTKNENHDKNFAKFTLSIKENNIIHNNEESTKNIKKTLFGNLFVSNKESDLSNIFTNEKASIKISGIDNKKDLFGNNICNDNKISLINNHDNFNNLFQKENNKEEFIEFELIYKYNPNEKPDYYKDDEFENDEFEDDDFEDDDFEDDDFEGKEDEKIHKVRFNKRKKKEEEIGSEILYHPINKQNKIEKNKKLKILDQSFIINNKDKCKIIYKNKEYELKEYFEDIDNNYNKKDEITIKLRINKDIVDMRYMFYKCNSLIKIRVITKVNSFNDKTLDLSNFDDDSSFKDDPLQNITNEGEENSFYMYNGDNKISESISNIPNIFSFDNLDTFNGDNLLTNLEFNNITYL